MWGECPRACVKVSPVTWDKPKGKRRGQTMDGRLEIKSPHATMFWGHCDTCANPEVLDCKPSLGNPWLIEPRTKDRYSPLLSPQEDNSDLYSTGLFGEALEGSNQLPIVVINLIIYTWGGFPFFPCFVFEDSSFPWNHFPQKAACQYALTQNSVGSYGERRELPQLRECFSVI